MGAAPAGPAGLIMATKVQIWTTMPLVNKMYFNFMTELKYELMIDFFSRKVALA